jgi:hypothetical protein
MTDLKFLVDIKTALHAFESIMLMDLMFPDTLKSVNRGSLKQHLGLVYDFDSYRQSRKFVRFINRCWLKARMDENINHTIINVNTDTASSPVANWMFEMCTRAYRNPVGGSFAKAFLWHCADWFKAHGYQHTRLVGGRKDP